MDNLPEDIENMAKYLGREDPAIQRLLKCYIRDPENADAVRTILRRRCIRAGFNPDDLSVFWPVRQLSEGQLHIGRVLQGNIPGPEFSLPIDIINQHLATFGHNGTGKSYLTMYIALQAIKAGLTVWIFDIEDEYSRLIPLFPDEQLIALEPELLRFNFFQPPGNWIKSASWIDELSLLLRGATFLRDGSLNLFRTGLIKMLERKGITKGQTDGPSLVEVINYFQGLKFGPKMRSAGFLESLLNRIVTMADAFNETAAVSNSNMLENLGQRSTIFRLHSLTGIPLQFLVGFLLLWLSRFREGIANDKPHLVIIEEAHMLSSEKARQDIGESILCRMFRTARKRSIGLILCDQVPSELPPAILGNLACRIVMRLANARCIWSIQSSMGLDRKQAEAISTMEPRKAVVHYTLHPTPFAIEIPEISFPVKPQESELRRHAEEFLSKSQWSYHKDNGQIAQSKTKMFAPDDLAGDALLVMMRICREPADTIEQRCEALQMDRAREFRARAELDARGLISEIEQTISGKIKFFNPTDKGIEWAQKRDIHIKKFKSGIVHEYLLCQIEKNIGTTDSKLRLQRNSSIAHDYGLQPDLLVKKPEGGRIIVEICCNNLDYDAKNILTEAEVPGVDHVIAITPDKRTKKLLLQALRKNAEGSTRISQKLVKVLDASECLADKFDWSALLAECTQKLFPDS